MIYNHRAVDPAQSIFAKHELARDFNFCVQSIPIRVMIVLRGWCPD
jgi:hypothetical protein